MNGPEKEIVRSGRSTAIALNLIARAISNPGDWINVWDHYDTNASTKSQFDQVRRTIIDLKLKNFEVDPKKLRIMSTHYGILMNNVDGSVKSANYEEWTTYG